MKKLINHPEAVVEEMVEGLVTTFPHLQRVAGQTVIVRQNLPPVDERGVAIISGGGSGHEPAHAGYVGQGMLSAAVAGAVFTSPSPDAVLAAIRATAGPRGALLIVKNYTGDRLNFGLAAELARSEGIPVEIVLVADDVALADTVDKSGRRGLAGTIFVHKVAGAVAEAGGSLDEVAKAARNIAEKVQTMGVALTPCTVPAAGKSTFELGDNEIELGLGIHGEPGHERINLEPADALVDRLLNSILSNQILEENQQIVFMVNNLGGTPTMEMAIVTRRAIQVLTERKLTIERVYTGTFLTALEMAGVSLSVLPITSEELEWLDVSTTAPAWSTVTHRPQLSPIDLDVPTTDIPQESSPPQTAFGKTLHEKITNAANALIQESSRLTELDQAVGDGDLGITLERGAKAVLEALDSYPLDDASATLRALGLTLQKAMGGTSGPLYAVFFIRGAEILSKGDQTALANWAEAFAAGCDAISELGGAKQGSRTMLDALIPASKALSDGNVDKVVDAAKAGAKATAEMMPQTGRSSYLGKRAVGHPDPGAEAVVVWLNALLSE